MSFHCNIFWDPCDDLSRVYKNFTFLKLEHRASNISTKHWYDEYGDDVQLNCQSKYRNWHKLYIYAYSISYLKVRTEKNGVEIKLTTVDSHTSHTCCGYRIHLHFRVPYTCERTLYKLRTARTARRARVGPLEPCLPPCLPSNTPSSNWKA